MDRKEGAAGILSLSSAFTRVLPAPFLAGLILWMAFLPGCNSQGSNTRQALQQVRPISNTARLVQNAAYFKRTGRIELAVDELEQGRLKEPDNLEILDVLIQSYEDLGDFDRAQELYEEALGRRGGHHAALENNRCYSLYLQGRLDQAEACFRKALARQPDNQKARNNLGLVLCRQGREAEALAMWREALNDGEARQRMGQAMAALGKETPPSLAGPPPALAEPRVAAAVNPAASANGASLTPKTAPTPSLPSPAAPPAALARQTTPETPLSPKPARVDAQKATPIPPRPTTEAAAGKPGLPASLTEQPLAQKATPGPEQPRPQTTAVVTAAASHPGEAPSSPPVAPATVRQPKKSATPLLTATDLGETRIEVKNGNGIQDLARETRSNLFLEGFNVVGIGNHIDFGLEETVIAHRPEATKVAQALAQKFFPGAKLEAGGKLSRDADIRVSLGRDQIDGLNLAHSHQERPAALASAPAPAAEVSATATPGKSTRSEVSRTASSSLAKFPDFLTPEELNQVRIELKNGNGSPGQAWEMGGHLALEGFTVVNVGNYKDFGLDRTVITYRPEAARVAQVLLKKFFPKATLEEEGKLPPWTDVRVSLGRDLLSGQPQMAQASPGNAVP
jgi:Tfp pilus assembly protein PilF